jgi:hypothetical protein
MGDVQEDFALEADLAVCSAPGYELSRTELITEDFDAGIPVNWSVVNNIGSDCVWRDDDPGGRGNSTGGSGIFAIADSDDCDPMDTDLQSPAFDATGYDGLQIEYKNDYYDMGSTAQVQVYDGSDWTTVDDMSGESHRGPETRVVNTGAGSGASNAQVQWHYVAGWDWWWQVDDVRVYGTTCSPPANGGLVMGHVYDENTNDPLAGADVWNDSGEATSTDQDGSYTLFSPAGTHVFSATLDGYGFVGHFVSVPNSGAAEQNFDLPAGMLGFAPTALEATLELGDSTVVAANLANSGGVDAKFELLEKDRGFQPVLVSAKNSTSVSAAPAPRITSELECEAYETYVGAEPVGYAEFCMDHVPNPTVSDAAMLAPTDIGFALDIGYISDNFVTFTLNDFAGQTVLGTNSATIFGMDFDPSATTLYALNDTTGELGMIDLVSSAFTGLVACPAPVDRWTGLSIDPVRGVYYASDATSLYTIDPSTGASTLIGPFGTSSMIDIAVNPDGEMYGHDIGTDSIYQIDPSTGAATLIGPTGYNANYAQGMDFDNNDGILYIFLYQGSGANVFGTVDLSTGAVIPLATDNPLGEFEGAIQIAGKSDVPWLSEAPISGTVSALSTVAVDLTFDASVPEVDMPGKYYATLLVNNDTPYGLYQIPVTLTVTAPDTCTDVTDVELTLVTTDTIYPNDVVDLSADIIPNDFAAPYTYTIDFGDGTTPDEGTSNDDPLVFTHTYASTNTYTVQIEVLNCEMMVPVIGTVDVIVGEVKTHIYLPLVMKSDN